MRRNWLGEQAKSSAISAPSPADGEVRRTTLPDTFDGIRFEIGRMVKYVQDARKDPLLIDTARLICSQYGRFIKAASEAEGHPIDVHNNKTIFAEGLDLWCRDHFCYINDPPNIEVIQTPRRMIKQTRIPREVIEQIMGPFYKALAENDPALAKKVMSGKGNQIVPVFTGDCDEAATAVLSLAACADLGPLRFRFGGHDGTLHHVWARMYADGDWYDSDITEPSYRLGDHSEFEAYEEVEIPL
jgi:hypothetical protein